MTEDTSLSTGGTLTISDDDAGEGLSRRKPTRQAHTARSTSAPMAWTYSLNTNDPDAVQELGRRDTLVGNLHSDVGGRRHRA
ncbi:hypothetical protein OH492_25135 [Vibrio chagasii]|nr:hypothetical protein [Vibrio chagasii]